MSLLLAAVLSLQAPQTVDHALTVQIDPAAHRITVVDEVLVPLALRAPARFRLHGGLGVPDAGPDFTVVPVGGAEQREAGVGEHGAAAVRTFELRPNGAAWPADGRVRLRYAGVIHDPLVEEEQEYGRSFARTAGLVDERGVVLSGSSFFVPNFGDELVTFRMAVAGPPDWLAVSQGERIEHAPGRSTWACPQPMDEVYLVAAPFREYSRPAGPGVTAYAFLRSDDPNLAAKYLEATVQYVDMYARLIGPYPFAKFALVENFWETGYGMPSFTLLGAQVIRLPFILHTSYPHEILHNWWGNSVFVDVAKGNWCEGLTAYQADHLLAEGQGRGAEYRRDTLKKYRDYVRSGQDFPLVEFRSRHSSATEAIGYGKALMVFHMLRQQLGDEVFKRGCQQFYRDQRYRRAAWSDVSASFGKAAERDLAPYFAQWTARAGAPELALGEVQWGDDTVRIELQQVQPGEPWKVHVPVAIGVEGKAAPFLATIVLDERSAVVSLGVGGRPESVHVDPAFDVFRRLDRSEIPPSIGQLFGAVAVTLVLPGDDDPLAAGWRKMAEAWTGSEQADVKVVAADQLQALPADRAVWILGSSNPHAAAVRDGVRGFGASLGDTTIDFGSAQVSRKDHAFVMTAVHPGNPDLAIGWLGADRAAALPGLARKLPHYGKYSYLAFAGDEPSNDAKGQWTVTTSPLIRRREGSAAKALALPGREPLARPAPVFDGARLLADVQWLAADERQGRGVGTEGLAASRDRIVARFTELGLEPGGDDGTFLQALREPGGPDGAPVLLHNVVGVLRGTNPAFAGQSVVLGAHYDHLGRGWPDVREGMAGQIHNGADDNASGVAVLLEVARVLRAQLRPERSVVFVAFSGEEWGRKGSRFYVRAARQHPVAAVIGMLNLDTVGRLGKGQLQVLGCGTATEWPHIVRGIGFTTGVQAQAIADDPGGSDQQSFVEFGVPAVQLFSGMNEDYHRPSDDADKIDGAGLVAAATFAREAVIYLSERKEPLTATIAGQKAAAANPAAGGRRTSLGTMPDFGFAGPGVKVAQVTAGSAAALAGIQADDVLLAIDGAVVADLQAFSALLRQKNAGDKVEIRLRRGSEERTVTATLTAR